MMRSYLLTICVELDCMSIGHGDEHLTSTSNRNASSAWTLVMGVSCKNNSLANLKIYLSVVHFVEMVGQQLKGTIGAPINM